jgi:uncharacterized protein (DUF1800 family)
MCCILCVPATPGSAQSAPPAGSSVDHPSRRPAYKSGQLQGDARILHTLDRFTFGPRPGDLEAVRAMGLEKWFDGQLHPTTLDQSDLNARLAQFPAMQSNTADLLFRFPSNPVIRQAMNGKAPIPPTGTLHAVYENQIHRLEVKKAENDQKLATAQPNPAPMAATAMAATFAGNMSSAASTLSMDQKNPSAIAVATSMDILDRPVAQGPQPAEILALAPRQRVTRLQSMPPDDFDTFMKSLRPVQHTALTADLTPALREALGDLENPSRVVADELLDQRLTRDIHSNAQLQEVMTDFWLNHFNVFLRKDEQMPYYLVSYERDVIRPLALGKFEDLLEAVAHSPAMLLYLDNASSIGPDSPAAVRTTLDAARHPSQQSKPREGLNENYARELMELHTLGVNGGYTQADVIQVARVLTGWTVDRPQAGGGFVFNPNRHEPGTKKVMDTKIKEHGEDEGRELLHMLAARPATAQFLARELAVRFVSDNPPQSLVDRMAKSYLSNHGDLSAVLKTLFHSPEFWSPAVYRAKVKTPIEFVVSALRASNAQIDNFQPLDSALRQMGMPLYGCVPPSGYHWDSATWVSTGALVDRMNFALSLATNRLPGITVAWAPTTAGFTAPSDPLPGPESEEARLEPLLVPGGVSAATRSAALQQFQAQIAAPAPVKPAALARNVNRAKAASALEKQDQILAGLILGSPEFQRR